MPHTLTIVDIAEVCHEANRALQRVLGEEPSPPWAEYPEHLRESAVRGVGAALAGQTPEQLHESWALDKISAGYSYGPVKDDVEKTHPCLVSYEDLPLEQRRKDYLFQGVVLSLTDDLDD